MVRICPVCKNQIEVVNYYSPVNRLRLLHSEYYCRKCDKQLKKDECIEVFIY